MTVNIPHNALIVVADGTGARFFRNSGQRHELKLTADGELHPSDLLDDGPSGRRPTESTRQETNEATFAKQLAHDLYRRAHNGDYAALVLVADPQTLGQLRPILHKEVESRVVAEHGKTMTKASIADILKLLD
jgi:protein required for attachment to host cells